MQIQKPLIYGRLIFFEKDPETFTFYLFAALELYTPEIFNTLYCIFCL